MDLNDLLKTCHPINEPPTGSCPPMWSHGTIRLIAWQVEILELHFKIEKFKFFFKIFFKKFSK